MLCRFLVLCVALVILHNAQAQRLIQATQDERQPNADCNLKPARGKCSGRYQRWFYDSKKMKCKKFKYGGCGGNENRFFSWGQCVLQCPYEKSINLNCMKPKVAGPCQGSLRRWHYNAIKERCEPFQYGGCLGNDNRFKNRRECEANCPARQGCLEPKKRGPCGGYVPRYYFSKATRQCEQFIYGGCEQNGNNFLTKNDCESECAVEVRKRMILHDQIFF